MGDRNNWYVITAEDEGEFDTFRRISRAGTAALYSIDSLDKARAVPFVKIWQVDRDSNKQLGPVLSDQFVRAPNFGQALGTAFGERPDVSLESITVKSVNPGGWIMYREVDIAIVVHRTDVLNSLTDNGRVMSALMIPNNTFVLRYGWVGGGNSVLGPGYNVEEKEPELTAEERAEREKWKSEMAQYKSKSHADADKIRTIRGSAPPPEPKFYKTIFPARRDLRFIVTNYNFSITPDNQLRFHIHGIEDAELQVRAANIFNQSNFPQAPTDLKEADKYLRDIADYFTAQLREMSFTEDAAPAGDGDDSTGRKTPTQFVELQDVLNILFSDPITKAVNQMGYPHVHLYTGVFNAKCPQTTEAFGGQDWANFPIGEFWLKLSDVQGMLDEVVRSKGSITVYNLLKHILTLISSPGIWKNQKGLNVSVPEMQLFTLFNPETGYARVQVVDRKRYLTLTGLDEHGYAKKKTDIQKTLSSFLAKNYIPYLTLFHQNSFFRDAKFDVVNDELMKSIFIQRSIKKSREQTAAGDSSKNETNSGVTQTLLLYRSAIKGNLTMIGNFVFDLLGMLWMNFNVPRYNGLFYVISKSDHVSREGFETTVALQAEGSDPLGTGVEAPDKGDPNAVRRNQPQVAEDAVKERIMLQAQTEAAKTAQSKPIEDVHAALEAQAEEARIEAERARVASNDTAPQDVKDKFPDFYR